MSFKSSLGGYFSAKIELLKGPRISPFGSPFRPNFYGRDPQKHPFFKGGADFWVSEANLARKRPKSHFSGFLAKIGPPSIISVGSL